MGVQRALHPGSACVCWALWLVKFGAGPSAGPALHPLGTSPPSSSAATSHAPPGLALCSPDCRGLGVDRDPGCPRLVADLEVWVSLLLLEAQFSRQ